jgi:hypothetical protein
VTGPHPGDGDDLRSSARDQEEQERLNRQILELLNELRVAMPGVQVLFGFLLAVPFQQRFATVDDVQRTTYAATLVAAAVATAFLIAPSAMHRVTFRQGQKPAVIRIGTRQFLAGLVALALAMLGAVTLVLDFLFQSPTPVVVVGALAVLYLWLWFAHGLWRRLRAEPE